MNVSAQDEMLILAAIQLKWIRALKKMWQQELHCRMTTQLRALSVLKIELPTAAATRLLRELM